MIHWRNRLTPALAAVAVFFILVALFWRPHPLPSNSARYKAATPIGAVANRKATLGVTYAIDSVEVAGTQYPINGAKFKAPASVTVHGWAVVPDTLTPGKALFESTDGKPSVSDPSYGLARPDVGAVISPTAIKSGFATIVNLQGLKAGRHAIHLVLENSVGMKIDLPQTVEFMLL